MTLILLPMTVEDIIEVIRLSYDIFLQACPVARRNYPYGSIPTLLEHSIAQWTARLHDPDIQHERVMKAVDAKVGSTDDEEPNDESDAPGEIVAFAHWHFWKIDNPAEEWDVPFTPTKTGIIDDIDINFSNMKNAIVTEGKRECIKGRRHAYLVNLGTKPEYQRRGCGSMLLEWGLGIAKEEKMPCFLIYASEVKSWYEKRGFEEVSSHEIELGVGDDGVMKVQRQGFMRKDYY